MNSVLKKDFDNKKRLKFVKSDLNIYLVDKNQIREYRNRIWFKGSRYR